MRWLDGVRQSTELLGAPHRLVHIGDRESDIYELFCLAEELGTKFLVRTCVDRLAESRHRKISEAMAEAPLMATHDVFRAKEIGTRIGIMKAGRLVDTLDTASLDAGEIERIYLAHMHDDDAGAARAGVAA